MSDIISLLIGLIKNVFCSLRDDLLFSRQPQSIEEQLLSKMRGQSSLIHSHQDRLTFQSKVIQDQESEIRDQRDLLIQKDKEVKRLSEYSRSLEFQLQEANARSRRWQ